MIFNPIYFCVYLILIAEKRLFIHGTSACSLIAHLGSPRFFAMSTIPFMTSLVLGQISGLYPKYGMTAKLIAFIESMIKVME